MFYVWRNVVSGFLFLGGSILVFMAILEGSAGLEGSKLVTYGGGFVGGGMVVYAVIRSGSKSPAFVLRSKARAVKPFKGKTLSAVGHALGRANGLQEMEDGRTRYTWSAGDYKLVLTFSDGVCVATREDMGSG